jgi:murein DD-endopeptidase MepM/ murein hydrolase activator NlpD
MASFYTDRKGRRRPITDRRKYSFPIERTKAVFQSKDLSPYHSGAMKEAVDIATPVGSKVLAARRGIVADVGESEDGSRSIEIAHDDGESTDYSHLSKQLVKPGQQVEEGQTIGLSGDTGDLAGLPPHLHFEVDAPLSKSEYSGYHSVPFEWKDPPETVTKKVVVSFDKRFYEPRAKRGLKADGALSLAE